MCYEYPGPRCGEHVFEERVVLRELTQASEVKMERASVRLEKAQQTLDKLDKKDPEYVTKLTKAQDAYRKAKENAGRASNTHRNNVSRLRVNEIEYNNTLDGISDLENHVALLQKSGKAFGDAEKALTEARNTYQKQVLAYDKLHGTVNFLPPAENYDDESIAVLKDKIRDLERKANATQGMLLVTRDSSAESNLQKKLDFFEKEKSILKDYIKHCEATQDRIRRGFLPDTKAAQKHREEAAHAIRREAESYERSDTDGFMTQWAGGLSAEKSRLKAEIAENNGKSRFRALFDLNGDYVPARQVNGQYGPVWKLLSDPDDYDSAPAGWVNESKSRDEKKQAALLLKKGYTMGLIEAPSYVGSHGDSLVSVRNIVLQDFRLTNKQTIDVLTVDLYNAPVD